MKLKKDINDIFFQVPREGFPSSIGKIELPILYYDVNLLIVFYFVDFERSMTLLQNTDLEPIKFYNGKSLVTLALFEYKDTSVGRYNEVGLAIAVKEKSKQVQFPLLEFSKLLLKVNPEKIPFGFYVVHLPVTTKEANVAGREIWGYPKFVTEIPLKFDFEGFQFYGSVLDPENQTIFELKGDLKSFISIPAMDLITYTYYEDQLIRTHIDVVGNFKLSLNKSFTITNVQSHHPMAQMIKQLNLEHHKSFLILYSNNWQSRLNKGNVVLKSTTFFHPIFEKTKSATKSSKSNKKKQPIMKSKT